MIRKILLALTVVFVATDIAADPERSFSLHAIGFRNDFEGAEVFVRQSAAQDVDSFTGVVYGISISAEASIWVGAGLALTTFGLGSPTYLEVFFMPGIHARGNGPNLGHPVLFRMGMEVGYPLKDDSRIGFGFDHRSNGYFGDINPGMETAYVRYTVVR